MQAVSIVRLGERFQVMTKPFLLVSMLFAATFGLRLAAYAETAIDPKSWLTPDAPTGDRAAPAKPSPGLMVPKEARAVAINLLTKDQIVELEYEQAQHLLGVDPRFILGAGGLTPYLVRAVSPNSGGSCSADQRANILFVLCGSLGDWQYELTPVIVFLRQKPNVVNISAMTAR